MRTLFLMIVAQIQQCECKMPASWPFYLIYHIKRPIWISKQELFFALLPVTNSEQAVQTMDEHYCVLAERKEERSSFSECRRAAAAETSRASTTTSSVCLLAS